MKMNYTSICFYCGVIYTSNKSTSKYCCREHNSMFSVNGTKINNLILTPNGTYVDYSFILLWICIKHDDELNLHLWSKGYTQLQLLQEFEYDGRLPQGSELIVVGQYLIKKTELSAELCFYYVKMIFFITKSEKATCMIAKGSFEKELIE